MAFKRKRSTYGGSSKRRRFTGRFRGSRFRGRRSYGSRVSVVSGAAGSMRGLGFRSKRVSRRMWRSNLWKSTLAEPHWRSNFVQAATIAVPAAVEDCVIVTVQGLGDNFWTQAGGTVPIDNGGGVPDFIGDITLRGGMCKLSLSNNANADTGDAVKCRVFMVWTNRNPELSIVPSSSTAGWDPSLVPDFERVGRVIGSREFYILPGNKPMEVSYRFRPRKVDQAIQELDGEQFFWFFTLSGHQVGADSIVIKATYNVSFAADAIQVPILPVAVVPTVTESQQKNIIRVT